MVVAVCSTGCIGKGDNSDVEWLVNVLAHHTHLSHLSLYGECLIVVDHKCSSQSVN